MELTSRLPHIIVSCVVSQASVISGCFNDSNITTPTRSAHTLKRWLLSVSVCVCVVRDD